jgi:NAD(P)-dependent dehydrogenase (short-subunit alcohol dehydrogenase family)
MVDRGGNSLSGQRALVTGATSGLGRAIALRLAADGAHLLVHGRDQARGEATVAAIIAVGGRASFIAADLGSADEVLRLAREAGAIDLLVNNAGFSVFSPTADLGAARFDALFASNVRAPFVLVGALAPGMAARGRGCIINISSMAAQVGLPTGAAYGASKAALEAMTRAWAAEFSAHGVRVMAVAAGPVYTDGAAPDRTERLGQTTALGRAAQAEEIASVVAFLASAGGSYITGSVIAVDGGRTAI